MQLKPILMFAGDAESALTHYRAKRFDMANDEFGIKWMVNVPPAGGASA